MSRSRLFGAVGVVMAVVASALTYRWFVSPSMDEPQRADAVVMLAGGQGERLEKALELMDAGLAPELVIMNGLNWSKGIALCLSEDEPFDVSCPEGAQNTRGEAQIIRELAADRGWETINLVTSDYHIRRASNHVGRCFDGTVHRVGAENDLSPLKHGYVIAREWAGTLRSMVIRGC